jgi:hypothetical protein
MLFLLKIKGTARTSSGPVFGRSSIEMNKTALVVIIFFILGNTAISSTWWKFAEDRAKKLYYYYDADSYRCFKRFDIKSGRTLGDVATVWIKLNPDKLYPLKEDKEDKVIWSIDCSGRKIDKDGSDKPNIYGKNIKPGSIEEKLYKKLCPFCQKEQ